MSAPALVQLDVAAMLRDGVPEPRYDLQDLLVEHDLCYMTAAPKDYKTWIALDWAICLASGLPWAGLKVTGDHRILFVEAEQWRQIPVRFKKLCAGYDLDPFEVLKRVTFFRPDLRLRLETDEHAFEIRSRAKDAGATWTFIDSFVRIHGLDENSSKDMGQLANVGLLPLRDGAGCGVLILDHTPKAVRGRQRYGKEQVRGSGEKLAAADCHLDVDVIREDDQHAILINVEAQRNAVERDRPLCVELLDTINGGARFQQRNAPERRAAGRPPTVKLHAQRLLSEAQATTPGLTHSEAIKTLAEAGITGGSAKRAWRAFKPTTTLGPECQTL